MLFITGLSGRVNDRVIRSEDGKATIWAGVIDDLWQLGKPRGVGGPWKNTQVKAGAVSDAYLMTGYDRKSVELTSSKDAEVTLEIDVDGTGVWVPYRMFDIESGETVEHEFDSGFSAYWVRAVSSVDATATVWFRYE